MQKGSTIVLFIAAFVLPFSAWALLNLYERKFEALPVMGKNDHRIALFQMTNQDGKTITADQWQNKIVVVDFFFTHCPTICPKMTHSMKRIYEAFSKDDALRLSSFSVDPERDSAVQLKKYAGQMEIETGKWDLLTGDKKEIYKLARNSFMIVATDGDGGPNDFIHSEKLVLVDLQKRIRGYYDGTSNAEVNQLIKDIKKLKNER